ncbi:MAG: hypothetical protein EOO27_04850 [Comamonadaceae bacterium]|nr:MAG: hypothetical protein EOO27_04850 [Comamonadaceae bacterium]
MSHLEELEVSLAEMRLGDQHAALISLCRATAQQMDDADGVPTNRLSAVYLSCLKDLTRASSPSRGPDGPTSLSRLRSRHVPPARPVTLS